MRAGAGQGAVVQDPKKPSTKPLNMIYISCGTANDNTVVMMFMLFEKVLISSLQSLADNCL